MIDQSAAESARNKQDKNGHKELETHSGYRNMAFFGWLLTWIFGIMFPFLHIINYRQFFGHRTKISFLTNQATTENATPKPIEETKLEIPPRKVASSKTKKIKRKFFNKPLNNLPNQSNGELN